MTAVNPSHLILLDVNDEYKRFEEEYNAQLFSRFTNKSRCLLHVLSTRPNVRLFHFFIPNVENTLIRTRVTLFQNTIFYIYCIDDATVRAMERTYNYPMFVKAFHVELLPTHLHQAAILHLIDCAGRSRHEPDEHDTALQGAIEHLGSLIEDLTNHMIITTGVQPEELH